MQPTQGGDLTGRANNLIVFMQIYMKLFKTLSILQDRYSTLDASKTQRSGHNFANNTYWYSDSEQQLVCKGTSFIREHQQIYTKFINSILRSTCTRTCSTISLLKISRLLPVSTSRLLWRFGHLLRKIYYEYNSNIRNDETHGMPSDLLSDRVWKKIMRRLWQEYA